MALEGPLENVVLGVHGGVSIPPATMTPELEMRYRASLRAALTAGFEALRPDVATALDGVEAAVRVLEDDPLFNAGKGAVFTHDGRIELDAAIMSGVDRQAGAVAGVSTIRNPITAARAVMERSKHVLLIGAGAELFAREAGLDCVTPVYFWTQRRWDDLLEALADDARRTHALPGLEMTAGGPVTDSGLPPGGHWGTVGAVALDPRGHLAAATSTGGMTNKRYGRVGDSPIIGAGTFADDTACAVSCTGHGEYFIRFGVAHELAALLKHGGRTAAEALAEVVDGTLRTAGGEGGAILLEPSGRFSVGYNTDGLFRGCITRDGQIHTGL